MLNDIGIAHFKEIQITPFLKGEDFNAYIDTLSFIVPEIKIIEHALHKHDNRNDRVC